MRSPSSTRLCTPRKMRRASSRPDTTCTSSPASSRRRATNDALVARLACGRGGHRDDLVGAVAAGQSGERAADQHGAFDRRRPQQMVAELLLAQAHDLALQVDDLVGAACAEIRTSMSRTELVPMSMKPTTWPSPPRLLAPPSLSPAETIVAYTLSSAAPARQRAKTNVSRRPLVAYTTGLCTARRPGRGRKRRRDATCHPTSPTIWATSSPNSARSSTTTPTSNNSASCRSSSSSCRSGSRPGASRWSPSSRAATPPARAAPSSASPRRLNPRVRARGRPGRADRAREDASGTSSATSPTFRPPARWCIFDRSWYNRAGVERVMGFCTEDEVQRVLPLVPAVRGDARSAPASSS